MTENATSVEDDGVPEIVYVNPPLDVVPVSPAGRVPSNVAALSEVITMSCIAFPAEIV